MHSAVYAEFYRIVAGLDLSGPVLEVGATPSPDTLLAMDLLRGRERYGVNIAPASSFDGCPIIQANGNDLSFFEDGYFACVVSNATIEHDPYFWRSCAEMRRVLRPGGAAVIGAPGYGDEGNLPALGLPAPLNSPATADWPYSTLAYRYHGEPKDYYRFSPDAFREVIFEGYRDVTIRTVLVPPRHIGCGFKV